MRWVAFALIAAAWVAGAQAQSVVNHPAVEAFGTLPALRDPSLSPDGNHLALIKVLNGRPVATIWALDGSSPKPVIIPFEEGFIDDVRWANNNRLLVRINLNGGVVGYKVSAWYRTVAVDADGQNPAALLNNINDDHVFNGSTSTIVDMAPDDPDNIYMPLWADYGLLGKPDIRNRLYRVNVNTGRAQMLVQGGTHTSQFVMDGAGNVVARVDQTKDPLTDHLLAYKDGSWREIAAADAANGYGFSVEGLTLDGKSLVLDAKPDNYDTRGLFKISLADGKQSDFYFDPIYDLSAILTDPWTTRVIGVSLTANLRKDTYFDPVLRDVQISLDATFPGMAVHALSWDRAKNRFVIVVQGPTSPPAYYLYTRGSSSIAKLGSTWTQVQQSDLGEVKSYDYSARDGLPVPAYLTLPPGKTPNNLPVVVLPHGGPMARDDMSFDWESQFLANRGYAVLRPNFRGSSGYGRKFEEAGYGQWGLKMQDDVTDGVKKLIADGIADPKRICIVGASYGGYAALAGAAFTPDLYACAAAWAPVTDLSLFLNTRAEDYGSDSWMISTWTHYIGDRRHDAKKLDEASPAKNAAKIKAPVLLMHGEADSTVRIDQSEEMEQALRKAHKTVTLVRIPKETHYMETSATRLRWLSELEKFLKANIGD